MSELYGCKGKVDKLIPIRMEAPKKAVEEMLMNNKEKSIILYYFDLGIKIILNIMYKRCLFYIEKSTHDYINGKLR